MAAANASLGVRSDHWKIAVARAERLENVRPRRVSFIVGNSQKSLGARSGEYPYHVITLPDTLRRVKPCFHRSAFAEPTSQKLSAF